MAWLGALPAGAFPVNQMMTVNQPRQESFLWGKGGQRITADQLEAQRRLAQEQMAIGADYSPVGHWTQGLARLANGVIGGIRNNRVDNQIEEMAAQQAAAQQAEALRVAGIASGLSGGDPVLAALLDPTLPESVRSGAKAVYERANPAMSEFERALEASGVARGTPQWVEAMVKRRDNFLDPMTSVPLPGGQVYLGPRSGLSAVMGGGDPASGGGGMAPPTAPVGKLTPIDGGPTPTASGGFR